MPHVPPIVPARLRPAGWHLVAAYLSPACTGMSQCEYLEDLLLMLIHATTGWLARCVSARWTPWRASRRGGARSAPASHLSTTGRTTWQVTGPEGAAAGQLQTKKILLIAHSPAAGSVSLTAPHHDGARAVRCNVPVRPYQNSATYLPRPLPGIGPDTSFLDSLPFLRSRLTFTRAADDPFLIEITPDGIPIEEATTCDLRRGGGLVGSEGRGLPMHLKWA